jgi:hypothetical protein
MPYYTQKSQYCNYNYNTQQQTHYRVYCVCQGGLCAPNYSSSYNMPYYTQNFCITNYPCQPNYAYCAYSDP